jgi:hypothetical protein
MWVVSGLAVTAPWFCAGRQYGIYRDGTLRKPVLTPQNPFQAQTTHCFLGIPRAFMLLCGSPRMPCKNGLPLPNRLQMRSACNATSPATGVRASLR